MADNKLQSLNEIFNEKLFRIPDFQRGFSWETKQIEDFWNDLINLSDSRIHYTGLLTVEPINLKEISKQDKWQEDLWLLESGLAAYYIIDGQQRLTTAILLLNELLKGFKDDEGVNFKDKSFWIGKFLYHEYGEQYKSYIFGYEKDNPSDEFFKTQILEQKSSSSDKYPQRTLYTANLMHAKNWFSKQLKDLKKQELEIIFKKLVNRLKFNYYQIDDEIDVFITFETMNNRGKPLSNLELLKNRLIYLSTMLPEVDQKTRNSLRRDINEVWKTVYEYLGKNHKKKLNDDDFLKNHWTLYFKYDREEAAAYAKFLLDKHFTAKNVLSGKINLKDIKAYIDNVALSVKSYYYIFNPYDSHFDDSVINWLNKMNRLSFGAFIPIIITAINKNETNLVNLLYSCESFVFLVFTISRRQSNTKNNYFYRLANDYNKNHIKFEKLVENINYMTTGEYGEGDDYVYDGWCDVDKYNNYIKDTFQKDEGFYSWNGLKYFLFEYEEHLRQKANGDPKVDPNVLFKKSKEQTIEHIYPQTDTDPYWKERFKEFKKREKLTLMHNLGNLLLLSRSKNSELSNKSFDFKKKHKDDNGNITGYFNGSYSEIEVSSFREWDSKSILKRGKRMLLFFEERWNISINEWDVGTKQALLQLAFLNEKNKGENN